MSVSHLDELRAALDRRGWAVLAERPRGEWGDARVAATWEVGRRGGARGAGGAGPLWIDFDGVGGMGEDLPIEQSYACRLRGRAGALLYFRRFGRSRALWLRDLDAFVAALESAAADA